MRARKPRLFLLAYRAITATWERNAAEAGHRAGRKAGASVVLVDGQLTLYVERGGRTLLTYSDDAERLRVKQRRVVL